MSRIMTGDEAEIDAHTVTHLGFNGYPLGDTVYGVSMNKFASVVLEEGDIMNRRYKWFTPMEFKAIRDGITRLLI